MKSIGSDSIDYNYKKSMESDPIDSFNIINRNNYE